ncbi:hypothetical protein KW791_00120 [Candidatus Parcubacteria bacterium]|nr:hypothetical protein [Candidatus Parcubacteria bacterium]
MFNLPPDKEGHIRLGLLIGMAFSSFPFVALAMVLLVAIGKEIFDYVSSKFFHQEHNAELLDAVCTVGGGVIGIIVPMVIYIVLAVYVF